MKYGISGKQIKELAESEGINHMYLYQILSGKRRPSLELAIRLYEKTGVHVSVWASRNSAKISAELAKKYQRRKRVRT